MVYLRRLRNWLLLYPPIFIHIGSTQCGLSRSKSRCTQRSFGMFIFPLITDLHFNSVEWIQTLGDCNCVGYSSLITFSSSIFVIHQPVSFSSMDKGEGGSSMSQMKSVSHVSLSFAMFSDKVSAFFKGGVKLHIPFGHCGLKIWWRPHIPLHCNYPRSLYAILLRRLLREERHIKFSDGYGEVGYKSPVTFENGKFYRWRNGIWSFPPSLKGEGKLCPIFDTKFIWKYWKSAWSPKHFTCVKYRTQLFPPL